jgi:hypothetical protein
MKSRSESEVTMVFQKGSDLELPEFLHTEVPQELLKVYADGKPIACDSGGWFEMPTRVE